MFALLRSVCARCCALRRAAARPIRAARVPEVLAAGLAVACVAAAAPEWTEDFEGPMARAAWSGQGVIGPTPGGSAGLTARAADAERGAVSSRSLPLDGWRGCTLRITARVRALDVGAKPDPWNGIKVMLAIESPQGRTWPQAELGTGTFEWRTVSFLARVPPDATAATLVLGLERVAGAAWFDDIRIGIARPPPGPKPPPLPGPRFTGHSEPRLRGAMVGSRCTAEDLRVLGQDWKANLVRWQLIAHVGPGRRLPLAEYDGWLEGELRRLDALLPACSRYGLRVALDLHSPPGGKGTVSGYSGSDDGLFTNRAAQAAFVAAWRRMAARYRDTPVIWGYDLANEPVEENVAEDCDDWHALATRAARAIRDVDPARAIIVEAPPWGSPDSLREFRPIAVSNVVYSCHMYVPHEFTHQGVFRHTAEAFAYPGAIGGRRWDKAALEAALQPAIDFQRDYNVHIYIGEFSAIRWAPAGSAERYLRDVIDIFEAHGWDWSYHAFREWQGWSVEHGDDRADERPAAVPTDRAHLLRAWFSRNAPRDGGT